MNFRIIKSGVMTRRDVVKTVFRWIIYSLMLIIAFSVQSNLPFVKWQPMLCISVACAVSFFESELSGFIFAAICGMMQDLCMGSLFGFTSIWLAPCCLFATLLTVNLIHRNLINFMWINTSVIIIVEAMELLFKYIIWRNPYIDIVLLEYMLPAVFTTVIAGIPLYLIVKLLNRKLGLDSGREDIIANFDDTDNNYEQS